LIDDARHDTFVHGALWESRRISLSLAGDPHLELRALSREARVRCVADVLRLRTDVSAYWEDLGSTILIRVCHYKEGLDTYGIDFNIVVDSDMPFLIRHPHLPPSVSRATRPRSSSSSAFPKLRPPIRSADSTIHHQLSLH